MKSKCLLLVTALACSTAFGIAGQSAGAGRPAFVTIRNLTNREAFISIDGGSEIRVKAELPGSTRNVGAGQHSFELRAPLTTVSKKFDVHSSWVLTISDRKPRLEFTPAGGWDESGYIVSAGTNIGRSAEVFVDGKKVASVPPNGSRVHVSWPIPTNPSKVEVKIGNRVLATSSTPNAPPADATISIDIISGNDGIEVKVSIEPKPQPSPPSSSSTTAPAITPVGVGAVIDYPIHTDIGTANSRVGAAETVGVPRRIGIDALDLNSEIRPWDDLRNVGNPRVGLPHNVVGWWTTSPRPGQVGISLLLGHVNRRGGGPSIFGKLNQLKPGDKINVTGDDGRRLVFEVYDTFAAPKTKLPPKTWQPVTRPELRLVSCEPAPGEFVNGHYLRNRVVFAYLVQE